jgi:transcriptional regulator with XRE-family HTH domain
VEIVGANIRRLRELRGITLRELAQKTDLSAGFLSQIENGKNVPSLSTAKKIADVLSTTVGALVGEEKDGKLEYLLVRKEDRPKLENIGHGLKLYFLSSLDKQHYMEPTIHVIEQGTVSGVPPFQHDGQEFILILKGRVEIHLDSDVLTMREGDGLYFDPHVKHSFKNVHEETAEVLCVSSPPYFY